MPVFGLVAAGAYDGAALSAFLRKLRPDLEDVIVRLCGNDRRVRSTFKNVLKDLRFANRGRPVDKTIVVCDTHGLAVEEALGRMQDGFNAADYPFPVEFAVVVPELESWLSADHEARTVVAAERGNRLQYPIVAFPPEDRDDPKAFLESVLLEAGVRYTAVVAARLAELSDPERVRALCPSFTIFRNAAHNC